MLESVFRDLALPDKICPVTGTFIVYPICNRRLFREIMASPCMLCGPLFVRRQDIQG